MAKDGINKKEKVSKTKVTSASKSKPSAPSLFQPTKSLKRKNEEPTTIDHDILVEPSPKKMMKTGKANEVVKPSSTPAKSGGKSFGGTEPLASKLASQSSKFTKADEETRKSRVMPSVSVKNPKATNSAKGKRSKAPELETEPTSDEEEAVQKDNPDESEEEEEHVHLHGFSTDEDSSDEDDDMDDEPSMFDISKLPTVAKDDASVKHRLEKAKKQPTEDRGVLYLGRLPHGFYEDQMKAYFSQFGNVTRLRISRNKKTGKSKHYGFIEFDSSSVAQIVADTMDNYLLMGHILQCKVIPKAEVRPELWVGANRKWRIVPTEQVTRAQHNKLRTEKEQERVAKRLLKRQNERKLKFKKLGINYNLDAVSYKKPRSVEATP